MLANRDPIFVKLFGDDYDFVNEFFIAPATRKNVDFLIKSEKAYGIIEVKTDRCNKKSLRQALYYSDLLDQRPWVNRELPKYVILIGKRFSKDVKAYARFINEIDETNRVILIKYSPDQDRRWANLEFINDF